MNNINKSYYAIIPANVRYDKDLSANAKLLYGEMTSLCDENGYCRIDNNYFAELYQVSNNSISKWINSLVEYGYITIIDIDIVSKLKSKNMSGLGFGDTVCEWCNCKTVVLHKHHYPIPKSEGGTKTVSICPNCHHEFHYFSKPIKLNISKNELQEIKKLRKEIENGERF